ncbi:hypothetical protein CUMW_096930 [Citrus unshiu]|uniref:Uncharacterized protein n=1 Tax=Citrus unshiu TaxID=55188 RepID=A0A2H5P250_CITUN|nr:hypothetical protein CUMW_096930 [Citrus unshiu]
MADDKIAGKFANLHIGSEPTNATTPLTAANPRTPMTPLPMATAADATTPLTSPLLFLFHSHQRWCESATINCGG